MDYQVSEGSHQKKEHPIPKAKQSYSPKDIKSYKETKAKLKKAERQPNWGYVKNIIEVGDPNQDQQPSKQKRFWSYIKTLRKDSRAL